MKFKLRPWSTEDVESLVKYANNENIANFLTDQFPNPYNKNHGKSFIEMTFKTSPPNILAIDINGEAVGSIGIYPQNDIHINNAELGYWLGEPFWGNGIITLAIKEMIAYCFKNWDFNRIYARPFGNNIGSQRVLEKAGFVLEGRFKNIIYKNGVYLDELIYAVRKDIK